MSSSTIARPKGGYAYDLVMHPEALAFEAATGYSLVDLRSLGILPGVKGGSITPVGGFNAAADLVTQTSDGFDLNSLWNEFQATVTEQNRVRQTLVDFLTFPVALPTERVPQISSANFEKASEYGEPRGVRPAAGYFKLGYDFEWYDLAARFTWKFLAEAPASQVEAINSMAIEADNRMVFQKVMDTLFDNRNRLADIDGVQDVNVYALYNADGTVPPTYKSNVHSGTHTHYLTSGAVTVDPADLDDMLEHLRHHGYSAENGMNFALLCNIREVRTIRTFRVANGASYDFIPASGNPAMFLPRDQELFGSQVPGTLNGLDVEGSYGPIRVVNEDYIPAGYMALVATGGRANLNNPVGFREHSNTSLRGLRLVKGPNPDYPLIDSFYNRGFGTGVRQRGGTVIMQVTASGSYTRPTIVA